MNSASPHADPSASSEAKARASRVATLAITLGLYALSIIAIVGGVFLLLVIGRMAGVGLLQGSSMPPVVFLSLCASVFGVRYAGMRLGLFDGWF